MPPTGTAQHSAVVSGPCSGHLSALVGVRHQTETQNGKTRPPPSSAPGHTVRPHVPTRIRTRASTDGARAPVRAHPHRSVSPRVPLE